MQLAENADPSQSATPTTPLTPDRSDTLSGILQTSASLTPFFIGMVVVALWVACFAMGAIVNSQPYRDFLNAASLPSAAPGSTPLAITPKPNADPKAPITRADLDAALAAKPAAPTFDQAQTHTAISNIFSVAGFISLVFVVLTFTPPNLAILSALAAVAGAAGRWMTDGTSTDSAGPARFANNTTMPFSRWVSGVLLSALARGFFVYLALLSGLLVLTGDPFDSPTPGQYVRLAGTCSLFCFIVGWQPGVLSGMINRFINVSQLDKAGATTGKITMATTSSTATTTTTQSVGKIETIKEPKVNPLPAASEEPAKV